MADDALAGCRVVMTQQRAEGVGAALADLGASVAHVPLTEVVEPADGAAALKRELGRLARYDWLVVTSVNGARRVGATAKRAPAVRLAAVGGATASALEDLAGRPVDLVPARQRAEGLVAEFPAGSSRILVAQGDLASATVVEGLRQLGHTVTAVEAYRTAVRSLDADELDALRRADVVVVASGSAAASLAGAGAFVGAIVAIGPVTAEAALGAGLTVASIASTPADDDLVAAVRAATSR